MLKQTRNNNAKRNLQPGLGLILLLGISACFPQTIPPLPASPHPPGIPASTESPLPPTETSLPEPSRSPTNSPYQIDFPDPAGVSWSLAAAGLDQPVDIQNAGDGSRRLFIVEKRGRILVLQNDQLLPQPFLDIRGEVDSRGTEQGLLGLAFHPHYAQNGTFFVYYIDLSGNSVVASFQVSKDDTNRADPASEVDLLHVSQPYSNHNGGGLAFGPDGNLTIGLGDGGSGGDPLRNGQNLQSLLGKLLRINVDSGGSYTIPPDNPFSKEGGRPEIWAYGLRNPWRFSFDRLSGNLYIGDVGQDTREEVDFVPAGTPGGLNFGWSLYEGMLPYQDQPPAGATFSWPIAEYAHSEGCSVTGGYVYRGQALPEWQGIYIYGDYCSGRVWGLIQTSRDTWQSSLLFSTGAQIATFGVDESGEIYLADYRSGTLLRLTQR